MPTGDAHRTVLTQKLTRRQVGRAPLPHIDQVAQSFCALIEKAARGFFRCDVGAMLTGCAVRKLDATLEQIHLPAMLGTAQMQGVQDQALVNLSSDLVYHIVDLRLGGDPNAAPRLIARSFTAIDVAISKGFVETVISEFGEAVERILGLAIRERLSLDRMEENVTQLNLATRNADVLVIALNLDIGEAARNADLELVMPLSMLDGIRAVDVQTEVEADSARDLWREQLQKAARRTQVELQAIVGHKHITLGELADLEPGMVFDLPRANVERVELMLGSGTDATLAARGELGTRAGQKVLRLTHDLSPELKAHLMTLQ